MLLGIYHPRRLLLTTPSYTFNARFTPPNISERSGYPDPTGRTNRIFRHHDHKFEWTVEEFKEWCEAAGEEWGYNVIVETIGRALEKDPWGRDAECGGASQVAEFTRKDGTGLVEMREVKSAAVKSRATQEKRHELLITHQHTMHPSAQLPIASLTEISEAVKLKMEQQEEALMRFEELWFEKDIAILCGGWIELLKDAVEDDERLRLLSMNSPKREDWRVELVGGMQRKEDLWSENAVPEDHQSPIDGSEPEEDFEDAVEDEDDVASSWSNAEQKTEGLDIYQGWGTNGSSWGEPKPWILSGSDKEMVGGEKDKSWAEVWGSANGNWETISTGVNTGPGATRKL
jgi:small RNA 2'-O-methyltransferase